MAGAILHDIGKIEELSYVRSFGYSSEGQLLGHIVIGLRMVGEKMALVPDFPAKLRSLIEHMIVSHHGELQFGSPKMPIFREALLLHHLDNLDSKMEAVKNALKRDAHIEGEFTGWVGSLERSILHKDRYLKEVMAAAVSATAEADAKVDEILPEAPATIASNSEGEHEMAQKPAAPEPQGSAPKPSERPEQKALPMTLFGEKLQAVLNSRK